MAIPKGNIWNSSDAPDVETKLEQKYCMDYQIGKIGPERLMERVTSVLMLRDTYIYMAVVLCRRISARTMSRTVCQLPASCCRNSRMVGYQGLSARFNSQRHSAAHGSSSHTGFPRLAARWATAVSTAMTRSMLSIKAAVCAISDR